MPARWCFGVIAALVCFPWAANSQIVVGPAHQVSTARSGFVHFEALLAADPTNVGRLLACSIVESPADEGATGLLRRASEVSTYLSIDGGSTWRATLTTKGEAGRESWDPACTYGPGGAAY